MSCDFCTKGWDGVVIDEMRFIISSHTKRKITEQGPKGKRHIASLDMTEIHAAPRRYILSAQIFDAELNIALQSDLSTDLDEAIHDEDAFEMNIPIRYCPFCGSELKEAANDHIHESDKGHI